MRSEALKRAQAKYDKRNCEQVNLKLNRTTDKDILDKLQAVENKQGYIKDLIRLDIADWI